MFKCLKKIIYGDYDAKSIFIFAIQDFPVELNEEESLYDRVMKRIDNLYDVVEL